MTTTLDEAPIIELEEPKGDLDFENMRSIECKTCGDTFYVDKNRRGRPPVQCDNCKVQGKDRAPRSATGVAGGGRPSNLAKLEKALATQLAGVGGILTMFDKFDGMIIVANADENAEALCKIAERNPKVRKALENFVSGSAYGELGFVMFATVAPILANHGVLPPEVTFATKIPEEAVPHFRPLIARNKAREEASSREM